MKWNAYWRLGRFDKPVGILLLWFPTAWALWIANQGRPPLKLLLLFTLGTIFMRAAGCVMNDIADRHVDKHVARTKSRPLTSGEINLFEAFAVLLVLLIGSLLILINLPVGCFYLALIALFITVLYPFCKRFLNAPQLVLGLAFSMGIPMAYSASNVAFDGSMLLLLVINLAWIVAYDSMYAMTDKIDDLQIGVKSTAIYFGDYDKLIIGLLQLLAHGLWFYWAVSVHATLSFYVFWCFAGSLIVYQQYLISERAPDACFKAFLNNGYYGLLMWLAVVVA